MQKDAVKNLAASFFVTCLFVHHQIFPLCSRITHKKRHEKHNRFSYLQMVSKSRHILIRIPFRFLYSSYASFPKIRFEIALRLVTSQTALKKLSSYLHSYYPLLPQLCRFNASKYASMLIHHFMSRQKQQVSYVYDNFA